MCFLAKLGGGAMLLGAKVLPGCAVLLGLSPPASAMGIERKGDQLILSGPVVGDEYDRVADLLAANPEIGWVILRNSPGGHIRTGFRLGELFRDKNIKTAVSGYCYSSCSRMFLGGRSRYFTDDFPAEYTNVGFHGHYDDQGRLRADLVDEYALKSWIIKYSDGKADEALVERWVHIPFARGLIHFFPPEVLEKRGYSAFMCRGDEKTPNGVFGCEPVSRSAFDLGVVTSLEAVHSSDAEAARAALPAKPPKSGFAEIADESKVPLGSDGMQQYRRFLASASPRAFAIAPGGNAWAWVAGPFDAMTGALSRCARRATTTCRLYAVDDDVVWTPDPGHTEP
jgi:hypothetical protein